MMEEVVHNALIGRIYDAALEPDRWSSTMAAFGMAFGCHVGAVMFITDDKNDCTRILGSPDRQDSIDDYVAHWSEREPAHLAGGCTREQARRLDETRTTDIARATSALREGEICTDDAVIDKSGLARTAFYNEHLAKFDFHHALGAKIWSRPSGSGLLSLSRAMRQGAFTGNDLDDFKLVQPHLQRALAVSQRLAWTQAGGHAAHAGLERCPCPTVLLDQLGRCGFVNAAAEALIGPGNGLKIVRGRLQAEDMTANEHLARSINAAIGGGGQGCRSGGAVAVPRFSSATALALIVAPVSLEYDWLLPQRPGAIVTIVDPDTRPTSSPERLKALFRLTPSEAAVAIGIGSGRELKQIAAELKLTSGSTRQYLTRIYAKTNTSRQNDLSSLLTRIGVI